jgi:hypothetical protein
MHDGTSPARSVVPSHATQTAVPTLPEPVSAMGCRRAIIATMIVVAVIIPFASGAAAAPLTKAQYISKANALCATAETAMVPIFQQFAGQKGSSPTPQQIAAFIGAFAPVVEKQITKTRALKPPKHDQATVTKILKTDQTELNMVKANPELLGSKSSPFLGADSLARHYGLEDAPGAGVCVKAAG